MSGWKEDRDGSSENFISYHSKATSYNLPIHGHRENILYLLEQNQCLVIQGETGSGKSTQIPQFLLDAGWTHKENGGHLMIAVTQPRKVAAISVAARVAEERSCDLGGEVGYAVRFDEKWDLQRTRIKFMTEGILIREMMSDPLLEKYSVILIDEAHERSIQTDILLGCVKRILNQRKDLKVVVSSATLEAETLSNFFRRGDKKAQILCVEGRSHPIDVFYSRDPVANYVKAGVDAVIAIHENEILGDILFFLTGIDEIEEAVSLLLDYCKSHQPESPNLKRLFVLPLHASLPAREQFKVFDSFPRSVRKVIVATNVAEASVTIPGITYVVDCGFVKMRSFDPVTCADGLFIVPVSQASADQRAGRAGRTRSGKAYRLYPESEYLKLRPYIIPEIERSGTASLILQLKALGARNLLDFSFPSSPPEINILVGLEILFALGAIDMEGELTVPIGLQMAEFPVHPMHSRILLESGKFECSEEAVTIISMLQVENIFQQPSSGQRSIQARRAKHRFCTEEGDLITYLNVYNEFLSSGRTRSWADRNYLNYNALLRVGEIRSRLVILMRRFKIEMVTANGDTDAVRRCFVTGLFANAAYLSPVGERVYKTIRGDYELKIHPTSVLFALKRPPKCILYNEMVHATDDLMRDLLVIESDWLHQIVPQYYEYGTERQVRQKAGVL